MDFNKMSFTALSEYYLLSYRPIIMYAPYHVYSV